MNIEFNPPPVETRYVKRHPRRSYVELFAKISDLGEHWMSVPLSDISGETNAKKQTVVHAAARARKIVIQTTVQNGRLYIRRRGTSGLVGE